MRRQRWLDEAEQIRLPRPAAPAIMPGAFAMCPVICSSPAQLMWQQWVYQQAFAQAQAVVTPSLPERDLLGVWN